MSLRLPQCALFDLDGTLLDSLPGISYAAQAAFSACGLRRNGVDLRTLIGPPIRTILSRMGDDLSDPELDCLERAFRVSYDSEGWAMTPHYAHAAEMLRALRDAGGRLFVVSNKPRHIAVRILAAEGTLELFDEVVTRDSRQPAYVGKVEMISYLLEKWQLNAQGCVMVGDTIEDAEAASYTGMPFCLMTHGYGDVPAESGIAVAMRLDSFAEWMSAAD